MFFTLFFCKIYLYIYLFFRQDLNLPVWLETEIWKASCYINQKAPANKVEEEAKLPSWEYFGINWQPTG